MSVTCQFPFQANRPQRQRQTTLLLRQERRIRHHQVLPVRRPFIPLHLEHEADLRLRVCLMAKLYIHGTDERGCYLGHDHHESVCGSFAEYWAGGDEEVNSECKGEEY